MVNPTVWIIALPFRTARGFTSVDIGWVDEPGRGVVSEPSVVALVNLPVLDTTRDDGTLLATISTPIAGVISVVDGPTRKLSARRRGLVQAPGDQEPPSVRDLEIPNVLTRANEWELPYLVRARRNEVAPDPCDVRTRVDQHHVSFVVKQRVAGPTRERLDDEVVTRFRVEVCP
jgi:hypothetical protein